MSFGNEWTEIDLNTHQTTLIIGKNGSGKSSAILDSISFALFNKPFRNITKPQLTNTITTKQCLVELDFKANGYKFKVRRGIKPTIFEIFKDGELINQSADNRDYQDAFEKYILKVNHKTFCQIVMLGSAIFTPFMALPTPQRRAVIEDLLDLQIFSQMNNILSSRQKEADRTSRELSQQEEVLKERESNLEDHIKKIAINHEELINQKVSQIQEHNDRLLTASHERVQIDEEIQNLLETIQHQKFVAVRNTTVTKLQHQLQQRHQTILNEIKFLDEHEDCPTCKQVIAPEFKEYHIREKYVTQVEIDDALAQLKEEEEKITTQLQDIIEVQEKIYDFNADVRAVNARIEAAVKSVKQLKEEVNELRNEPASVDHAKLEETKKELLELTQKIDGLKTQQYLMDYASTLLKDSGIKAKIIKTFVPVINQLINKYLAALDFFVEFSLNEQFEEKILSRFRDEFSYESFSEGEKMRLNLAILFAWRALAKLRGSIDCNLVILDELLDGSLDMDGLENVIKLLTNIVQNENIFVISHKESMQEKFGRVVAFEKVRNFSRIAA